MNALGDRHVSLQFGNVHVRHTWVCTHEGCTNAVNDWSALTGTNGPDAMQHSRATGHETVLITEARTVHTITAEV